jgi:hypothetical protein
VAIENLIPAGTAKQSERSANRSLYQGNCARVRCPACRPAVLADRCCIRLYHADLWGDPTRPSSTTRSIRRRRSSQLAIARSTGRLITDIWRTGSGQSKRSGAPLAVADGDIIRSPGRGGERQGFWPRGIRACASRPPRIDSSRAERTRARSPRRFRCTPLKRAPAIGRPEEQPCWSEPWMRFSARTPQAEDHRTHRQVQTGPPGHLAQAPSPGVSRRVCAGGEGLSAPTTPSRRIDQPAIWLPANTR